MEAVGSSFRHVAVLSIGIVLGLGGCASSAEEIGENTAAVTTIATGTAVVPLDPRFASVGNLAWSHIIALSASPDGAPFAWISETMTGTGSVIEIDPSGNRVKRPVTAADGQRPQAGFLHGFAVTDEAVWMGAGATLFRLDRATGDVEPRPLPEVAGSAPGSVEINSIVASTPRGLVIGLRGAPAVLTFNPATAAFTQLRLPDVGEANSIAVLADGTVGAGILNNRTRRPDTVAIFSPSDRLTVTAAESILISAWGDGFLTTGVGATSVAVDGSTAQIDLGGSEGNSARPPAELADGRVVMLSNNRGLLVLDPTVKKVTGTITLGTIECGLGEGSHVPYLSGGPSTAATVRQSVHCPANPDHLTPIGRDLLVDLGSNGLQRAASRSF